MIYNSARHNFRRKVAHVLSHRLSPWACAFIWICVTSSAYSLPTSDREVVVRLGSTPIRLVISEGAQEAPLYLNLHENERTSVNAASHVLKDCPGSLVRLQEHGHRLVTFRLAQRDYIFDPNRIFTERGITATLAKYNLLPKSLVGPAIIETRKLRDAVLAIIAAHSGPIVALHNNAASKSFSFATYHDGARKRDAQWARPVADQSSSEFFLATNEVTAQRLHEAGFNTVLQNPSADEDGSLSVWSQDQSREYVNVEAKHGRVSAQKRMLQAVCSIYK